MLKWGLFERLHIQSDYYLLAVLDDFSIKLLKAFFKIQKVILCEMAARFRHDPAVYFLCFNSKDLELNFIACTRITEENKIII